MLLHSNPFQQEKQLFHLINILSTDEGLDLLSFSGRIWEYIYMGRGRDKIWEYAEKLSGVRFRCKYCESAFGGGATRIKFHLSQKGGDIQPCPNVPEDVRVAAALAIDHDHDDNKTKMKKISTIASSSSSSCSQTEMGLKRKATTNFSHLAKFMLLHKIPFEVAEAPLFDEFAKLVSDFRSSHQQPPSPTTTLRIQRDYDIHEQVEEYSKQAEESLAGTGCTLIFHSNYYLLYAWTSKGLVFKAILEYDDDYIKLLSSTIKSVGPKHILQLLMDHSCKEDLEEMAKEVFTEYPWLCVTVCANREIVCFLRCLAETECSLITCASLVFLYMKKNHPNLMSVTESDLYSNAQSSSIIALAYKVLEYDYEFVLGFLRLKSLLQCKDKLQALQPPVQLSDDEIHSRFFYSAIMHKEFWTRGKQLVLAMQPVIEAFCLLINSNNNYVTVGYLYQLMERAKTSIQGLHCCSTDCIRKRFNKMYERLIHPLHAVAALLDPAYLFSENKDDMKEGIDFILKNIVPVEERGDFMSQFKTYKSKDPKLFTLSALAKKNTSHPGEWWECCGDCVPVLQKYALKIVSQPCSSFFTCDELELIDEPNGELKVKMMMMEKSVTPIAHLAEAAAKSVDQLFALLDMEPYCSQYDCYFQSLSSLDDDKFWDSLDHPSELIF